MNETIFSAEAHGNDFLDWVSNNDNKMKKALKRNGTYDEDVYQDTILKVYTNIITNQKQINDFEQFFFLSNRQNYINQVNKERNQVKKHNRDFFHHIETGQELKEEATDVNEYFSYVENVEQNKEEWYDNVDKLFLFIANKVEVNFPAKEAQLYIIYIKLKSEGKITYKQLQQVTGYSMTFISNTIKTINYYVNNDPEIKQLKEELYADI